MNCIIKYDLKFNDILIPKRTKARIVSPMNTHITPDAPGVNVTLALYNHTINVTNQENEIECKGSAILSGILISTNTQNICIEYNYRDHHMSSIYTWQLEKIYNPIPEYRAKQAINGNRNYILDSVIDYMDEELAEWVRSNLKFQNVTKKMIRENDMDEELYGQSVLTNDSLNQFYIKQLEYQNKLEEATGYTYDFKGGLNWD